MVPWPIALLTLLYGVIAAVSAATVWQVVGGFTSRPLTWPLLWLAASGSAMCGLPLLKPWARVIAIWASVGLMLATLSVAALLVASGRPLGALVATCGAGVHILVIRYLRRPVVRAYFISGDR